MDSGVPSGCFAHRIKTVVSAYEKDRYFSGRGKTAWAEHNVDFTNVHCQGHARGFDVGFVRAMMHWDSANE